MNWDKKITKEFTLKLSELEASQLQLVLSRAWEYQSANYHLERFELEEQLMQALKDFFA